MFSQGQKNVKQALNATRDREVDPHQTETEAEYHLISPNGLPCMNYFPVFLDKGGY